MPFNTLKMHRYLLLYFSNLCSFWVETQYFFAIRFCRCSSISFLIYSPKDRKFIILEKGPALKFDKNNKEKYWKTEKKERLFIMKSLKKKLINENTLQMTNYNCQKLSLKMRQTNYEIEKSKIFLIEPFNLNLQTVCIK